MNPRLKALIERLGWKAGDVRIEPVVVRDEDGRILEINTGEMRVYASDEPAQDDLPKS